MGIAKPRRSPRTSKKPGLKQREMYRTAFLQVQGWIARNTREICSELIKPSVIKHHKQATFGYPKTWRLSHMSALNKLLPLVACDVIDTPHDTRVTFTARKHLVNVLVFPTNTPTPLDDLDVDGFIEQLWPSQSSSSASQKASAASESSTTAIA